MPPSTDDEITIPPGVDPTLGFVTSVLERGNRRAEEQREAQTAALTKTFKDQIRNLQVTIALALVLLAGRDVVFNWMGLGVRTGEAVHADIHDNDANASAGTGR